MRPQTHRLTPCDASARRPNLNAIALALALVGSPVAVVAQVWPATPVQIRLAAQPLGAALNELARQATLQLLVSPELVAGKTAPAVQGVLAPEAALRQLLAGSGLEAVTQNGTVLVRRVVEPAGQTLPIVEISADADSDLFRPFAGGQIARGGRLGLLGDRDVFESPFNITSFTSQAIADQQATKISEMAKLDPSVQAVGSPLLYQEEFLVRGFRLTQSAVGFDGTSGLSPNYGVGSLQAIERVEIFKGANTLLNGVTTGLTAGGYINLVPKRATAEPITKVGIGYESKSLLSTNADIGRRFGSDKQLGVRVNVATQNGETAFDDAREKRRLAALALDFQSHDTRIFLDAGDQIQNLRGAPETLYADPGIALPRAPRAGDNFAQRWNYSRTHTQYGRVKAEHDLTPDTTVFLAYGGHRSRYEQISSYGLLHDAAGNFDEAFQNGRGRVNVQTLQAGLSTKFDTGPVEHRLSLAATRTHSDYHFYYQPDSSGGGIPSNTSNIYDPVLVPEPVGLYYRPYGQIKPYTTERFNSVAIADTVSAFDKRLQVTLGLRRQQIDTVRYDYDGNGTVTGTYDKSATTPVVGVLFKVTEKVSLYGNYIESLDSGPTAPVNATNANEIFPPSKNKQYEIGVKYDLGGLALTADIFQITQPSGRLNPDSLVFSVDGQQRNRGVEFNLFGKLGEKVRLNGGAAYLDAKLTKTQDSTADGKRAPGIGKLNLAGSAEWDFAPGWTAVGGVRHTGAAYVDQANLQRVKAFTTFDAGLRYKTTAFAKLATVRATVTNITNRSYFVADPFGGIFKGAPRALNISATLDF